MTKKLVSIVIPCYNEAENINRTFDALLNLMEGREHDFEIIVVNDGSKDNTWDVIKEYADKYAKIIGVNQMRNYGLSAAYQAGFDIAKGDYIVILAADLEIEADNILKVVSLLDKGYDFVNTNRAERWAGSKLTRQVTSGTANKLITKISGVTIQDRGSGLKGFRGSLLKDMHLRLYGEMHRFMPDYISLYGAKITEFDVKFKDRDYGESQYASGFNRTVKVILDLLTLSFMLKFATKPLNMMPGRIFGFTGAIMTGLGGIGGVYLTVLKIMGESIGGRPLLTLSLLLIIVGVQSMMLGMLGELLLRIYFESSGRKTYMTREVIK